MKKTREEVDECKISVGDIIVTTEIIRMKLGQCNNRRLAENMIFSCPPGFVQATQAALEGQQPTLSIKTLLKGEPLRGINGEIYPLSEQMEISGGCEMAWFVRSIEDGKYNLVAIGAARDGRIADWKVAKEMYDNIFLAEPPGEREFTTIQGVDDSFFEKKAVFRLEQAEEDGN